MPNYRVTVQTTVEKVVDADNPFMAAVKARTDGEVVIDVRAARGRPPTQVSKPAKRKVTNRKPMSAATKAKLARNLAKARAAKKAKARAAKKA